MSMSARSSLRDHHCNYPSFSSSLLEEIYRSFDADHGDSHCDNNYRMMMKKKINKSSAYSEREKDDDRLRVNRFVVDQWIEKEKSNLRRKATVNSDAKFRRPMMNYSSSTSSSDSSSGVGGFSSSDTESLYGWSKQRPKFPGLKPIRTTVNTPEFHREKLRFSDEAPPAKKNKKEANLHKRALKLYGDLKKVKQPISPGGKLASFLNSLFNSGASKKPKISSSSKKPSASTPSTASSYSRSCLSKTPSSAVRSERRSVTFCPVNVIVDERDQRRNSGDVAAKMEEDIKVQIREKHRRVEEDIKVQIMEKHRRVEEVAKELLKKYHGKKFETDVNLHGFEEEDEDGDGSCCSSDLFELDNLLEIGVDERYREELPVYETTYVGTNRAIANGFIL